MGILERLLKLLGAPGSERITAGDDETVQPAASGRTLDEVGRAVAAKLPMPLRSRDPNRQNARNHEKCREPLCGDVAYLPPGTCPCEPMIAFLAASGIFGLFWIASFCDPFLGS